MLRSEQYRPGLAFLGFPDSGFGSNKDRVPDFGFRISGFGLFGFLGIRFQNSGGILDPAFGRNPSVSGFVSVSGFGSFGFRIREATQDFTRGNS